jgi:hypothetical protein
MTPRFKERFSPNRTADALWSHPLALSFSFQESDSALTGYEALTTLSSSVGAAIARFGNDRAPRLARLGRTHRARSSATAAAAARWHADATSSGGPSRRVAPYEGGGGNVQICR